MRWEKSSSVEGFERLLGNRKDNCKEHPGAGVMLSRNSRAIFNALWISRVVRDGRFTDRSWIPGVGSLSEKESFNAWSECIREHISRRMLNVGTELSDKEVMPWIHEALGLMGVRLG